MKNKHFGKVSINIILVTIILIVAILTSFYGININKILTKTSDFIKETDTLEKKQEATLIKCIDGDTFKLKVNDKEIKVRLLAVDTPEINKGDLYGQEAKEYACSSLKKSSKITISYEKQLTKKDKYNRHLVWLFMDEKLLQEDLVENGYAKVRYIYAKYAYTDKLLKTEKQVKKNHLRIWQDYKEENKNESIYTIIYKFNDMNLSVDAKNGEFPEIIDNPTKKGYLFAGWTKDGKLYDLSKTIKSNLILEAKFEKDNN